MNFSYIILYYLFQLFHFPHCRLQTACRIGSKVIILNSFRNPKFSGIIGVLIHESESSLFIAVQRFGSEPDMKICVVLKNQCIIGHVISNLALKSNICGFSNLSNNLVLLKHY
jgi:hypothetical protein